MTAIHIIYVLIETPDGDEDKGYVEQEGCRQHIPASGRALKSDFVEACWGLT